MSSRTWRLPATLIATGALVLSAVAAYGVGPQQDNLVDDLAGQGTTALTLTGSSVSTTINYRVNSNGTACDITTVPSVYQINLGTAPGGNQTAAVTASASQISFSACGVYTPITFTATTEGKRPIDLTWLSGPVVDPSGASTTLSITRPANTAPSVAVSGFTADQAFEYPAAPTPACDVTDAQDDNAAVAGDETTATPVVTGPVGTYASLGLGEYTVTCSYTDLGDPAIAGTDAQSMTTTATRKYTRNDTTPPSLNTPGDQVLEATGPGGAVATWTVDGEDALGLAGPATCDVASGSTFLLGTTTVNCTVTDLVGLTTDDSFDVTVTDETAPSIVAPSNPDPVEATSAAGAVVTYPTPTATDTYDPNPVVSCSPVSGSTFAIATTTVTCSATDSEGNISEEVTFDVLVRDTTAPAIDPHADIEDVEATSIDGAVVDYTNPTASDLVDGDTEVTCEPASGSTFPLDVTTVSCSSADSRGNTAVSTFTVEVVDTTAPEIAAHDDVTTEATGPTGASVEYDNPTATDAVDANPQVGCIPSSPVLVAVGGSQLVTCTATDFSGNSSESSFTLYVVDTTDPELDAQGDITVEATGPTGAIVTYDTPAATDIVDTDVAVDCTPASGVLIAVGGSQLVTCTATDDFGNEDTSTFTLYVVDTTAPEVTVPANITAAATSSSGAVVFYTATANDLVDGPVTPDCTPASGSTFAPGTTTVSCTATDAAGNTSPASTFTVTVSFSFNGFFAPVDNPTVVNTIKGGQSVPMKWSISNGSGGFISALSVVSSIRQTSVTCTAGASTDDIEAPTAGASALRYDTTANQYIYNWQSPKGANLCYKVTVNFTDGTSKHALFKTK